tara:strand:+ start:276 stop:446 length:171 start_codon:yes stop_codon:yes gene_type:complete
LILLHQQEADQEAMEVLAVPDQLVLHHLKHRMVDQEEELDDIKIQVQQEDHNQQMF